MKERVTLTVERDVLNQVDATIDGSLIKNRSHAFELLVTKALGKNKLTKAFILAGGNGTAKPDYMLEMGGKSIIQHNIELLRKNGIKEVLIATSSESLPEIRKVLGTGSELGVKINYIEEKDPMGTAGPLTLAKKHLGETFVMMNADEIKEVNIKDMYEFHREHDGFATIALTTVRDPQDYGVAVMNGNRINSFVEKPASGASSNLINAGLYILEPEVIDLIPEGYAKLEDDLFPKLARDDKLFGYPFSGQWLDSAKFPKYRVSVKRKSSINAEKSAE